MQETGKNTSAQDAAALQVYLLGAVDFEAALAMQRRLHYDIGGDRRQAALIVCEHSGLVTVGRQGSRRHLLFDGDEMRARRWRVRWVNRAGGCWLHLPGQLCVYSIVPLDAFGLTPPDYIAFLGRTLCRVLCDFSVTARVHADDAGVWVGGRLLAAIGVAVKDDVAYYGACFNLNPALDVYRQLWCHPRSAEPMTSLERERRGPVRPSMVRERIVEHFRDAFGFARASLFSDHPALHPPQAPARAKRGQGVARPGL